MDKQHRTSFFFFTALIGIIGIVLFLLFVPDMSSTLINTVPEYPPETSTITDIQSESANEITVNKENVKNIISAMKRPSEYFSETQSTLSHSAGSTTFARRKWVKGKVSRVDIMSVSQQNTSAHYIYTENSVYVWRSGSKTYQKVARGNFDADDAQMMMSYEDILLSDTENITTAQITMYDGTPCIYAEVKTPVTGYLNRYWVSYSTGLLIFGQTVDSSGSIVYSITATQTDISPQSDETFLLPDGTSPT